MLDRSTFRKNGVGGSDGDGLRRRDLTPVGPRSAAIHATRRPDTLRDVRTRYVTSLVVVELLDKGLLEVVSGTTVTDCDSWWSWYGFPSMEEAMNFGIKNEAQAAAKVQRNALRTFAAQVLRKF